jgi:hypothetical protein
LHSLIENKGLLRQYSIRILYRQACDKAWSGTGVWFLAISMASCYTFRSVIMMAVFSYLTPCTSFAEFSALCGSQEFL